MLTRTLPLALPVKVGGGGALFLFLSVVLAMSEAFAFASPVKLERQAHCMCYTCTSCCFEHPKPSRWFGRQKEKYGSVFHCLLLGILNVEWKEHFTLSFC